MNVSLYNDTFDIYYVANEFKNDDLPDETEPIKAILNYSIIIIILMIYNNII